MKQVMIFDQFLKRHARSVVDGDGKALEEWMSLEVDAEDVSWCVSLLSVYTGDRRDVQSQCEPE